ncbi:hypothetical protein QL285_058538 [Trifolium repens]|nr:hypothetical protein QL285_058538 [Trifolium repens]
MSQSSHQTSPTNTSPNKPSLSKTTTTTPNTDNQPTVSLPQLSDVITDAVPLTMVHPSFASALNLSKNTTTNPSRSPKPKSTKKSKTNTTKKPKSQKPKSRYSSNFNMQELYLDNQGSASENVASDAATTTPNVEIKGTEEISPKSLNCEKGEIAVDAEKVKNVVPESPGNNGDDEDHEKLKEDENTLKSLANVDPKANVVPDVPTSLAQSPPIPAVGEDVDHIVADSPVQQEKDVSGEDVDVNTDNAMSVEDNGDYVTADEAVDEAVDKNTNKVMSSEEDLVIVKTVGDSKKKSGKTGVGKRLRERKEKMPEVAAEATKSTKKKKVVAEITKSPKKKKVAAEATKSPKKKMYGPVRRSSRVEIPAKQKKQASKRKTIDLSDLEYGAEVAAEATKSTKKKKVVAEITKSPKKKKVAAEATKSPKKKMYGPVRRSSRVEIPAKQKKQASKRKTIDLSDSEYGAEEDAPIITTSSKQKTPKKRKIVAGTSVEDAEENAPIIVSLKRKVAGISIPPNVPDVPMDNVSFHFSASAAKWKFVYHRRLALERELSDEALECKDVMDLIKKASLVQTVSGIGKCYEKLVKEFSVNIVEDCDNPLSKEYHKVFVRGKCVEFSPAVINSFLGRREDSYSELEPTNNQVCKTITANQVKMWPLKGKVPSVMLFVKYAILNRIGAINWVPTTHSSTIATGLARFIYAIGTGADADFGTLIFDQIMLHGKSWAVKLAIAFPSLICGIILNQHPSILLPEDEPCKRESPMTLSYKLFEGKHAADITVPPKKVVPAGKVASSSMNRKTMIIFMEAAVNALDEQKIELEKVISALKQEEVEEEGLVAENAGVHDAGDGNVAAEGDAGANDDGEAGGDTEELEVSGSITSF